MKGIVILSIETEGLDRSSGVSQVFRDESERPAVMARLDGFMSGESRVWVRSDETQVFII